MSGGLLGVLVVCEDIVRGSVTKFPGSISFLTALSKVEVAESLSASDSALLLSPVCRLGSAALIQVLRCVPSSALHSS